MDIQIPWRMKNYWLLWKKGLRRNKGKMNRTNRMDKIKKILICKENNWKYNQSKFYCVLKLKILLLILRKFS
jgi:hypothetical protein